MLALKTFSELYVEVTKGFVGFDGWQMDVVRNLCMLFEDHGNQVGFNEGLAWERARAAKLVEDSQTANNNASAPCVTCIHAGDTAICSGTESVAGCSWNMPDRYARRT
jgi:hypothetical protein